MRASRDTPSTVGADETERSRAEATLRGSEEGFRHAFEHAPMGILLLGPDVRIQRANRAICAMLGYAEEELLGRVVTELVHPADRGESERLHDRVHSGEVDEIAAERRAIRKVISPRVTGQLQRRATPIIASRVTIAASSSSLQPSVTAGRSGRTM